MTVKLLLLFSLSYSDFYEPDIEIIKTPEFLERIERLKENPVNINTASRRELTMIPYIEKNIAEKIISRRKRNIFHKKEELLLIPGITPVIFDRIKIFITTRETRYKFRIPSGLKSLSRIERKFTGSLNKVYNRAEIPYKNFLMGAVVEKDYEDSDYLDYHAGSIFYPDKFILGDYDLDFGMGLIYGKPDFFYAGSGIIPGEKGITPHLSTYESNYLRGIAGSYKGISLFGSSLAETSFGEEKMAGASIRINNLRITGSYNRYEEEPGEITLFSAYFNKEFAGNIIKTEIATGGKKIKKLRSNLSYSLGLDNGKGFKVIYSNVPESLPTFRNSPFSGNEEIIYLHYEKKLTPDISGVAYIDLHRDKMPDSSFTHQTGIIVNWNPLKGLRFSGRLKSKKEKRGVRINISYDKKRIQLRNRFEMVNTETGSGFLAYTGFRYSSDIIAELRFILYETDDWDSRIYEYENGLPGTFTIRQLYGSGRRIYLLAAQKILPVEIYVKWSIDIKDKFEHHAGLAVKL